ncbi:peptidase [Acinetobacter sp. ANC 4470]|uniref:PepSY-associated TM helix domain-containing protein n=1 Tax=Acinetobacter sp. ANC 4470 TaxID=1977881 RepID=UPI000A35AC76|nr:PepSY-associated TM helix domain-containing protein [Acinetobacter sp. ANC 4470]OTG63547.1 peptidase [Acinetobacter sp. ANC 4470]
MQKSIRQSMAWLHSWTGLIFGWLLFAIFMMGSLSYYRHDISLWMQPPLAQIQVNQDTAIHTAYQYLEQNAPDAKTWMINLANEQKPVNQLYWQKADAAYESKTLNPNTGKELTLTQTQGGDFFYLFHFQLFGMPYLIGRLIVSLAAFIMLIALVSGIITHKKILTDFFTLRAFKGQRSYLDFHNVSSVIALPFFLTVTFTGLAIFFYLYLPWGMQKLYPENNYQYFEEINSKTIPKIENNSPANMLSIHSLMQPVIKEWGKTEYSAINIKSPNTQQAQITFIEAKDHSITRNPAQITLNAVTGEKLCNTKNDSAIATLNAGVYGLHMATFAQPLLRLALFFSGLLGCAMIASGLLLWSLKRQLQTKTEQFHLGYYLVQRLNVTAIIGLPIAVLSYFYANRIGLLTQSTQNYEVITFFAMWLAIFAISLCIKKQHLWKFQLSIFIALAFFLPVFNLIFLLQLNSLHGFTEFWTFFRIDLFMLIFGLLAVFLYRNIQPIQLKAQTKIRNKLEKNTQANSEESVP